MEEGRGVLQLPAAPDDGAFSIAVDRLAIEVSHRRTREKIGELDRRFDQVLEVFHVAAGVRVLEDCGCDHSPNREIHRPPRLEVDLINHGYQLSNLHLFILV
jgi:hypothetical protein